MATQKKLAVSTDVQIPSIVPVFPLPNSILFPGIDLPLYIFEPRYQAMLKRCQEGNKFMAVSLFKPGWENRVVEPIPSHHVVGVGYLRAVFKNKNGSSHIILRGVGRAKIDRYTQMNPYRVAKISLIDDKPTKRSELPKLTRRLKALLFQKLKWESENPRAEPILPEDLDNPVSISHLASFILKVNPYLKQDLLETVNSNTRIRHLIDLLEEELFPRGTQN